MSESPNVRSITALDEYDDRALYKIEWEDPAEQLITGIAQTDATILEAHSDEEWLFRIRFEEHAGLARFNQYCSEHDIAYRLNRVSSLADIDANGDDYGLTEAQYEAVSLAVERAISKSPRGGVRGTRRRTGSLGAGVLGTGASRVDKVLQAVFLRPDSRNS